MTSNVYNLRKLCSNCAAVGIIVCIAPLAVITLATLIWVAFI